MQPQGLVPLNSNVDLLLHMCCSLKTAYWNPLNSNVDLLLPDYEIIYELRNHPLNSNVDLLLLLSPFIALHSIKTLNSNVDLLLPIHSQYSKNKHFSTPICRPAKITAFFITLTFNPAYNFYISRLYSARCRPPGIFTL